MQVKVKPYHVQQRQWKALTKWYRKRLKKLALEPLLAHNALVGKHYGNAWQNVDYNKLEALEKRFKSLSEFYNLQCAVSQDTWYHLIQHGSAEQVYKWVNG